MNGQTPDELPPSFAVGDSVAWERGGESFVGVVAGVVRKATGEVLYMVRDDSGTLHTCPALNLRPR